MKDVIITYALSATFFYKNEEYEFFSFLSGEKKVICVKVNDSTKRINLPSSTVVQISEEDAKKVIIFLREIVNKTTKDLQEFQRVLKSLEIQLECHNEEICKISG